MCTGLTTFECLDGWTGAECKDRDFSGVVDPECPDSTSACSNGGTCFDNTCCCLDGYEGDFCQFEIDECESEPCQNGGNCRDEINAYECICEEGTAIMELIYILYIYLIFPVGIYVFFCILNVHFVVF